MPVTGLPADYEPYAGPSAELVRRALRRFPGRTARDLASLAQVSIGHVYCVLSSDVTRGRAVREGSPFRYWPVVLERPLVVGGGLYLGESERVEGRVVV